MLAIGFGLLPPAPAPSRTKGWVLFQAALLQVQVAGHWLEFLQTSSDSSRVLGPDSSKMSDMVHNLRGLGP